MSLRTYAPSGLFIAALRTFNVLRSRSNRFCIFALLAACSVFTPRATVYILDPPPPGEPARLLAVALNHAEDGDTILLRRGTYPLQPAYPSGEGNAPLQIVNKANVTVRGMEEGVEIFSDGPGELLMISDSSSIRLERITFRSNKAPVQNGDWLYAMIQLYRQNERLTFEDCQFLNFGNHAISQLYGVKETTDVVIRNCFFADGGDYVIADGAAVSGIGSRWLIESNHVERCLYGFEIEGRWGTNQNIVIRKNTLVQSGAAGIVVFATSGKSADFADIEISDNFIRDAIRNSAPPGVFPLGILVGGGERIQVVRNTIENAEGGVVAHAIWADLRDIAIEGNLIKNAGFHGLKIDQLGTNKASNILLRGNAVLVAGLAGIAVAGADIWVFGNKVEDCGWRGIFGGVEALAGAERVLVEGNFIRNRNTEFQDYGIGIRTDARDTLIGPNSFRDHVAGEILDDGVNSVFETHLVDSLPPPWESGL